MKLKQVVNHEVHNLPKAPYSCFCGFLYAAGIYCIVHKDSSHLKLDESARKLVRGIYQPFSDYYRMSDENVGPFEGL